MYNFPFEFHDFGRLAHERCEQPAGECMPSEPIMDLAHLGHLELLTPKPEESLRFFRRGHGMTESGREGDSVYLRAYDDYERHSLKLTASKEAGLGHVAYRTRSPAGPRTAHRSA